MGEKSPIFLLTCNDGDNIMSAYLIALVGFMYLYVSVEQTFLYKNIWMGIVYFGYALSNVGLYYLATKP